MAVGVLWLIVGLIVLALFVARLWPTLPPDPDYRRQVARWLAVFFFVMLVYSAWLICTRPRHRTVETPGTESDHSWRAWP
jgi:hypothetical protein